MEYNLDALCSLNQTVLDIGITGRVLSTRYSKRFKAESETREKTD
jgi:hypothetical protein